LLTLPSGFAAHANPAHPAVAAKLPAYGTVWVTAVGTASLMEFAPGAKGDTAPIADINGAATGLNDPSGLAIDHKGRLWVANFGSATISVFAPNATGNATPLMTLAGAKTELNTPGGIALAQNGDLWVANTGSRAILEFAPGAHGNVAPIRTIAGSLTLLTNLTGIAVSPDGSRVWITEQRAKKSKHPPLLAEFAGTAHGNVAPLTEITGSKTRLNDPYGVVVGINGDDPITDAANTGTPALLKFAPGAHGNAAPKVITGENTGLSEPRLIAIDATGGIWVPNALNDLILRFGPSQLGNVAPSVLLIANTPELVSPGASAVFAAPPSVPLAVHTHATKKKLRITWSAPHVSGGGILGYRVLRARKNSGPWRVIATTSKRSYAKSHPHNGFSYEIEAFNDAGVSVATHPSRPKI
jgi:DNA-binding beta-propeller fold protein YncE